MDKDQKHQWKISPSSLYEWPDIVEGKRCGVHEWDRLNRGLKEPSGPFPTLFGKIDLAMREATEGRKVSEVLSSDDGALLDEGQFLQHRSRLDNEITTASGAVIKISGYLDCYVEHEDGMLTVVDFKCSPVGDREDMARKAKNYQPQLSAYASAIDKKNPGKLKGIGILWQGPDAAKPVADTNGGTFVLQGKTLYTPLELDLAEFEKLLDAIARYLATDRAAPSPDCATCAYQEKVRAAA